MDINIQKPNPLAGFFHKLYAQIEDVLFSIIQKLPERFISPRVMAWMEQYTDKRITRLNQQLIRDRWQTTELQKAAHQIHKWQQDTD